MLLERLLEYQLVRSRRIVEREVAGRQLRDAAVLHDPAATGSLDADQKIVFGRLRDPGRRPAHVLGGGCHTRQPERGKLVGFDRPLEQPVPQRRVAIELHRSGDPAVGPGDKQQASAIAHSGNDLVVPEDFAVAQRKGQDEADAGAVMDAGMDECAQAFDVPFDIVRSEERQNGGPRHVPRP